MKYVPTPEVLAAFSRYVKLRKEGQGPDDILLVLQGSISRLSVEDRREVELRMRMWERSEGEQHKPRAYQELPPRPPLPPEEAVLCPDCGKSNHYKEHYCYACGHILDTAPATQPLHGDYAALNTEVRWGTATFDAARVLVLEPRGGEKPLVLDPPVNQEVIIGRSVEGSILADADMTPYRADEYGVSRLHAALRRHENTVTITDLGSTNGTYLNGQRLYAHEERCLHENDELRLGHLVLKVRFQRRANG